jgi:hypothetical protein
MLGAFPPQASSLIRYQLSVITFAIASSRLCSGGAQHWITAGAGVAETRGQAALPSCAARRRACALDVFAAQWNADAENVSAAAFIFFLKYRLTTFVGGVR